MTEDAAMTDEQTCAICGKWRGVWPGEDDHERLTGHAFVPPQPTDEQRAERRIADAYAEWTKGASWNSWGWHRWMLDRSSKEAFTAGFTAAEAPLKAQIARLEALVRLDRAAMYSLNGAKERAQAQVKALEERLAALSREEPENGVD